MHKIVRGERYWADQTATSEDKKKYTDQGWGAVTGNVGKKIGKKIRGGGIRKKGLGKIASGAAELGYGAYTGSLVTQPGTTVRAGRRVVRGVRKAKGGNLRAKGRADVKRRVRGAGLSLHNKATVKFRAKGVKSKTEMGF